MDSQSAGRVALYTSIGSRGLPERLPPEAASRMPSWTASFTTLDSCSAVTALAATSPMASAAAAAT